MVQNGWLPRQVVFAGSHRSFRLFCPKTRLFGGRLWLSGNGKVAIWGQKAGLTFAFCHPRGLSVSQWIRGQYQFRVLPVIRNPFTYC